jgi:hypothetical protein
VQVASLVALIKKRLGIEAVLTPGKTGQFEVIADGERVVERGGNWFTRKLGAGYPDLESVVEQLEKRRAGGAD